MLKKRGAGVLLHISSMPSDYGVGVFDENVIHFIDKIADMGFTYWQVLPFNPIDGANSPYCSPSAFAGNYIFINPKGLYDMGLVCEEDYKNIGYRLPVGASLLPAANSYLTTKFTILPGT